MSTAKKPKYRTNDEEDGVDTISNECGHCCDHFVQCLQSEWSGSMMAVLYHTVCRDDDDSSNFVY